MGPVGEDPRWESRGPFYDYLRSAFPRIHATLNLTKVNTYGLVYHWSGSDSSLKPLLLAAHQDVVPVDPKTTDEWTHPAYSGYFDGERIWGRGSSDDKSGLIGVMSTVETLLDQSFQPTRTIILAFGFDEEISGLHGARELSKYLISTYGENSIAMIVDEGGGYAEKYGRTFATVAVGEKGKLDVRLDVSTPGGHSSIPPPHTSIGMLASLIVQYESHPYELHFVRNTPVYESVLCLAQHAPGLSDKLRELLKRSVHDDDALNAAESIMLTERTLHALVGTTQAVDLIQGGVKSNALPEQAYAVVNHRIATDSSVGAVMEHDTALLKPVADRFNLSLTAFGKSVIPSTSDSPKYGGLELSDAFGTALEPAPVTPTSGDEALAYRVLGGTVRSVYRAFRNLTEETEDLIISPGISSGNTDTRYYWKLTPNIFRYNHKFSRGAGAFGGGVHTVNEAMYLDNFLEMIQFFTTLILNTDELQAF